MSLLSGATRGSGGPYLARHLLKTLKGQDIQLAPSRGLAAETLPDQLRELTSGAITTRTDRPLWHVHLDPVAWSEELRGTFWKRLESEFGLDDARHAGVVHTKDDGRTHEHRVYDITRDTGAVANLSYERMRREKIAVLVAFEHGLPLPPVPHLRAIRKALEVDGRQDVAMWVASHPRAEMPAPVASRTPPERAIEERRATSKATVATAAFDAWLASDSPVAFEAALADRGLALAKGDQVPVVVDSTGAAWPVSRLIGQVSREKGARIGAAAVRSRLAGLIFPTVEDVRRERATAPVQADQQQPRASEGRTRQEDHGPSRRDTPRRQDDGHDQPGDPGPANARGGRGEPDPRGAGADDSIPTEPPNIAGENPAAPGIDRRKAREARTISEVRIAAKEQKAADLAILSRKNSEKAQMSVARQFLAEINIQIRKANTDLKRLWSSNGLEISQSIRQKKERIAIRIKSKIEWLRDLFTCVERNPALATQSNEEMRNFVQKFREKRAAVASPFVRPGPSYRPK